MKYTNDFRRDAAKYVDEHPELTIKKVAGYLGIPKDTLYGWTKKPREIVWFEKVHQPKMVQCMNLRKKSLGSDVRTVILRMHSIA